MEKRIYTTIVASGSFVPERVIKNEEFLNSDFYDPVSRLKFDTPNEKIIEKFHEITNIEERRYIDPSHSTSDMGSFAALDAIESSGYDVESLDFIIFAHNFGDSTSENHWMEMVPALANRVKKNLNIKNPFCYSHDVIAGCPGWTTAMIVADAYMKSGLYKKGLVIGADTTSYYGDPYDRDGMIFADAAGAVIVEATESETPIGMLSQVCRADVINELDYLKMGESLNPAQTSGDLYIRMNGQKVYIYAIGTVPGVVKESLDKAGLHLDDVKKVLIHQANEKLDQAILDRVFKLYGKEETNRNAMPMTINKLGNSSSATVPVLYDLVAKGKMKDHEFGSGDNIIFASVGAGMNINSIVYRIP